MGFTHGEDVTKEEWSSIPRIYINHLQSSRCSEIGILFAPSLLYEFHTKQGHFNVRFDTERMNYDYIPEDKRPKYSYNEAIVIKLKEKRKLSSNIPNKESPANFNRKVTDACIQGYNLTMYI